LHNDGINIAANAGEPFYAAADGVVVYAANDLKGFGNMVILRHAEGWMTAYDHADRLLVKQNERVRQGQQIGVVGATGSVNQAQLHFGLRQGKQPVDPSKHLGSAYAAR
jgi:murein DD-endopeptidase MepM/ murein hydrolase activator NlpD